MGAVFFLFLEVKENPVLNERPWYLKGFKVAVVFFVLGISGIEIRKCWGICLWQGIGCRAESGLLRKGIFKDEDGETD